ncbi:TerD family protein [Streptomyces prasinopilosus]|uniref:Stress response protein SCP2 n=4 Tax=Streptomyces prasinopilosus TaxID=67344 RepID=A0A1G6WBJ3_9ACTN|nr:TerD family protein [Streptomyces prasinopilosus]SDD63211.1 Stress response protein SCP2 [Streptomyces prasinopilosus]
MAREFQRGHKARISDLTAGTDLYVGVQISGPGLTFDISCFGLDADERLSDDRYFIFFNQPKSPEESLQLLGPQAGDTESFRVTLEKIPQQIKKLSFTATLDGAGQMSQIGPGYIRIVAGGEEVARYPFSGSEFSTERAVMLGDFYFKDVWRFAAVGQGFDGGLEALLKNFGGEVAEEEPAAPQQPQAGGAVPGFAPPAFGVPGTPAPAPASPAPAPAPPAPAPQPAAQGFAPPPGATPPAPTPPVHAAPTIVAPLHTAPGGSPVPPPPPPPAFGHPGQQPPAPSAPPPPGYGARPHAPHVPQAPAPPPGYGGPPYPGQTAPGQVPVQQAPYGAPQGAPQGAPRAPGVLGALQMFKETPTGQRWTLQNPKLVRADLGTDGQPVLARQGSMVLYQGKVDFSYKGAGFSGRIVGNATGQEMQLMRCTGQGQVFFAEDATMLHPIELQGDAVCVSAESVLAFDEGLQYEVRRIEGHGIPGGALFTMQFQGTGTLVVKTHGVPVVLPVTPTTFADANAVVAWSAASQVIVSSQVRMRRNSYPGDTGESVNLQFRGAPGNFIVVQPYEI